jgi:hypothetical protein
MAKVCSDPPPLIDLRFRATTLTCPPHRARLPGGQRPGGRSRGAGDVDAVGEAPTQSTALDDERYTSAG